MPMPSRPTGITPTTEPRHVRDDPVHQDARGEAVHQDDGVRASLHLHHLFPEADGGGEREKQRPMPRVARIGSPRVMCCN